MQGSIYSTGNTSGGTLTTNISGNDTFTGILADGLFEDTEDGKLALTKIGSKFNPKQCDSHIQRRYHNKLGR